MKSYDFLPQIVTKKFNEIDWECCFKVLIAGYFLKMVVADNLKDFTSGSLIPGINVLLQPRCWSCFMGIHARYLLTLPSLLIAIGLAKLFGYNLQ